MKRCAAGALMAGAIFVCVGASGAAAEAGPSLRTTLHSGTAHTRERTVAKKRTLCNNTGDRVVGRLLSQQYEASYQGLYDTLGATDCVIGRTTKIVGAIAPGEDSNDPMKKANFVTYADAGGLPGATVNSQRAPVSDHRGTLTISAKPFKLQPGTYWFTVQAIHDYLPDYSEWFWFTTDVPSNRQDQWENPGGGFELCPTWCGISTIDGFSSDFLFKLLGKGA
jgi:hypothetical protein